MISEKCSTFTAGHPVCLRMSPLDDSLSRPDPSSSLSTSGNLSISSSSGAPAVVTQIDYVNFFIPNLREIVNCPYYWGKIDRYEAEALLDNRPEGSFLLRDSAQDEFVFSVSFRRYTRSLHARIEESKHRFSFDCHDPGVHSSPTVPGLLEYYKDPLSCMFFEPMLLHPVSRNKVFSLQELARCVVCDNCTYNGISLLPLPRRLKDFLREYNYKHKIRSRVIDVVWKTVIKLESQMIFQKLYLIVVVS